MLTPAFRERLPVPCCVLQTRKIVRPLAIAIVSADGNRHLCLHRSGTCENSFVMVNFSVWQNVSLEREDNGSNVAHATLCQQESNGAGCKQTAGCRQFVSPFPRLRERA